MIIYNIYKGLQRLAAELMSMNDLGPPEASWGDLLGPCETLGEFRGFPGPPKGNNFKPTDTDGKPHGGSRGAGNPPRKPKRPQEAPGVPVATRGGNKKNH